MIATVYARKSTLQAGYGDTSESVARQVDDACAFARSRGWAVSPEHIFTDDAISGAIFNRPALTALLAACEAPRRPFDVVIVADLDRLGREQWETGFVLKRLLMSGVRLFTYQKGQEILAPDAAAKFAISATNLGDEMRREKDAAHTRDAHARLARAGRVTGGRVYGYDNVDVAGPPRPDGRPTRSHVVRRVNPAQAEVIQRVFTMVADGSGFTRIAKALNADGVAPPRRARGWAPTAIREIVNRDAYRGVMIWGRVRKRDKWGRKVYAALPEETWVRVPAPELRIIADDLWDRAHRRLALTRAIYTEAGSRAPLDRDANSRTWRPQRREYLLSGIAKCAECGGSLVAFTRDMKAGGRRILYGCNYHAKRGNTVCGNAVLIKQEKLDKVVLDAIAEALDERLLERAVERAIAKLTQRRQAAPRRCAEVERELADVEARIQRGLDALLAGTAAADELRFRLASEKDRKAALAAELATLKDSRAGRAGPNEQVLKALRASARDIRAVLGRDIRRTRQILRRLLVGRLECRAFNEGGRIGYRFTGRGSYAELSPVVERRMSVVTPAGFEPAISTLKGSRPGPG
jgi:site-specific DNA recombinase